MQRLAQIGLGVVETQLDRLERGVRQALVEQHELTQIAAWNAKRERRFADIGVVVNERRGDDLNVQMRDGLGTRFAGSAMVRVLDPWRDQRHVCERR